MAAVKARGDLGVCAFGSLNLVLNPLSHGIQDSIKISFYLFIPESENRESKGFQCLLPDVVFFLLSVMRHTINLQNQFQHWAVEIHHEMVNRLLSVEIIAKHLLSFEGIPQEDLSQCAVLSQDSCELLQLWVIRENPLLHN